MRQQLLFEREEHRAEAERQEDYRDGRAVEAHAARFHDGQLAATRQQAEGHEHAQERRDRDHVERQRRHPPHDPSDPADDAYGDESQTDSPARGGQT
jgi:hypothetical protein